MGLLTGKTALITGAARGIGKAVAIKFAQEGANIAFTDLVLNDEMAAGLEATRKEIEAIGVKCNAYAGNAADFAETEAVVAKIKEESRKREQDLSPALNCFSLPFRNLFQFLIYSKVAIMAAFRHSALRHCRKHGAALFFCMGTAAISATPEIFFKFGKGIHKFIQPEKVEIYEIQHGKSRGIGNKHPLSAAIT